MEDDIKALRGEVEKIYGMKSIQSIGNETPYVENQVTEHSRSSYDFITAGQPSSFQARIEYTSMQDWLKAQKTLRGVLGVSNIEVLSLTSRQAEIKVHFQGRFDDMATDMSRKGYNIQETSKTGRYLIYSARQSVYNKNGGIVYR